MAILGDDSANDNAARYVGLSEVIMIGTTGEGWLLSMSDDPDSIWGGVKQFYECMEEYANERREATDPIIVNRDIWARKEFPRNLPQPGDGFAFYHSSRAGFPKGDKFGRKSRISAMGTLLDFVYKGRHDGKEWAGIKVSIEPDVLEFLKSNPIVRDRGSPIGRLLVKCVPQGRVESLYKADSRSWKGLVFRLPVSRQGESNDEKSQRKQLTGEKDIVDFPNDDDEPPGTVAYTINRRVRNTVKGERLKALYNCKCQVCSYRICVPRAGSSLYVEVHHLKPLGGKHRGRDNWDNMLVLCPNCHAEFDALALAIDPKTRRIASYDNRNQKAGKEIESRDGHSLSVENIKYHWERFREAKSSG
jgi:5-methylcytosine-specific restriction endonuclease McrA